MFPWQQDVLLSVVVVVVWMLDSPLLGFGVRLHHVDARLVFHARVARLCYQLWMLSEVVGNLPPVLPGAYMRDYGTVFKSNQRSATDVEHFVGSAFTTSINITCFREADRMF